jgi:CheY-like chemotaxis protein
LEIAVNLAMQEVNAGDSRGKRIMPKVLVVDDNVDAARMLSLLVQRLGEHEVSIAHDGAEALVMADEKPPEIVFLDIGLPGMDGLEVARKLRDNQRQADTLLVALTGYDREEDRQRSREAGFDMHLVKPVGVDTLRSVLETGKVKAR